MPVSVIVFLLVDDCILWLSFHCGYQTHVYKQLLVNYTPIDVEQFIRGCFYGLLIIKSPYLTSMLLVVVLHRALLLFRLFHTDNFFQYFLLVLMLQLIHLAILRAL